MPLIRVSDETYKILNHLKDKFGTFDNAIKQLITHNHTEQLDLSYTVPPMTLIERTDHYVKMPFDGEIIHVEITIPYGAGDLVSVVIGVDEFDGLATAKTEGYHSFPVSYPAKQGQRIWAEIKNESTTYSYPIAILVLVRELVTPLR